jgi:hypothetical protein
MKVIKIENSYKIWDIPTMIIKIEHECLNKYGTRDADKVLNRSYTGMYIEWWLHNIGYWLTLPFIKKENIKNLNNRFKHVDLEEH